MTGRTLLEGNIKKELIGLAVPLLLGNILQQLYSTVDALIVGRALGPEAFAAVGIASTLMNLFLFVLNGFCIGLSILFAQFYGAGKFDAFRRECFISISLGSLITVLLSTLFLRMLNPILQLIQTPDHLACYATSYLTVIIAGMITTYFYNLFSNILRSIGDIKAALYVLFFSVVTNAVVGYLFVVIFSFGVAGSAYATVLAQAVSAVCCYFHLLKHYRHLLCRRQDIGLHINLVKQTLCFGSASALQQSSLYIGKILVQGAVNTLGVSGIAAYTATMRIEGFANSFGDSGAQAMTVFISQNHGTGNQKRVSGGLSSGLMLHIILGISLSIIMFVSAKSSMLIFLNGEEPFAFFYGTRYMQIISIFYVLCFIGNAFVGYFQGTGKVMVPVIGTTLQIGVRAILAYFFISKLGLSAVAAATGIGWVLVVTYQIITYMRNRA